MSTDQVFILRDDVRLQSLLDSAHREGWTLRWRAPRRGGAPPFWEWVTGERDEDRAILVDHHIFGVRYLQWTGDGSMPGWLDASVTRMSASEVTARAREASSSEEKIARLCEAIACLSPTLPEGMRDVLVERLRDPDEAVRWMAWAARTPLSEATLDAVLGALLSGGGVPEDIEGPARELHGLVQASMRGELTTDLDTRDAHYLRQALALAFSEKKWRRVEVAAARLLWATKPLREREAAAAWAAAMAATDRPWKAWIAALVVSELDRIDDNDGMAAAIRAEVEPRLAGRDDAPAREDLHPVLWLLRDRSEDGWGDALDRVLAALNSHVATLEAEGTEKSAGASEGPPPWERDPFGNPYVDRELHRRIGFSSDGGDGGDEGDEDGDAGDYDEEGDGWDDEEGSDEDDGDLDEEG